MSRGTVVISHKELEILCVTARRRSGVPGRHSLIVADDLVDDQLRGIDFLRAIRLITCIKRIVAGTLNARPHIRLPALP